MGKTVERRTIRQLTESLMVAHADRLTAIVERDGFDARLYGYPVIADKTGFTIGTLAQVGTMLYLHAKKAGLAETEIFRKRMLKLFELAEKSQKIETWGKIGLLRGCCMLQQEGELSLLTPALLEAIRQKTVYDDFVDYETLKLLTVTATNYYYVAMACAGMRERLGFEHKGASDRFMKKLFSIMRDCSETGWMDEEPPHGRYDLYSVEMNLEILKELEDMGKPIPDFLKENAARSVHLMFELRNRKGYGFSYGRSISMFGENKVVEYLAWGIENGILTKDETEEALAYCIRCTERMVDFWYEDEKQLCNLWLDGRATESYRGIQRIFEVNMTFILRLFSIHKAFTKLQMADMLSEAVWQEEERWRMRKIVFTEKKDYVRATYILHYGAHVFMLPFVGMGKYMGSATYMPYPHEPHYLSAPPADERGKMPFLVPIAQMADGRLVMPIQYYENIRETITEEGIVVEADGRMATFVDKGGWGRDNCEATQAGFRAKYTFSNTGIRMEFTMENVVWAKVLYAGESVDHVTFEGADRAEVKDVSEDPCFCSPYGALPICKTAYYDGGRVVCQIRL